MSVSDIKHNLKRVVCQRNDDVGLITQQLKVNGEVSEINNAVLFARPLTVDSAITFTPVQGSNMSMLEKESIRQPFLLATLDRVDVSFCGEWSVEIITISQVSTLFSFLDFQSDQKSTLLVKSSGDDACTPEFHNDRNIIITLKQENKTFMDMLIYSKLYSKNAQLEGLFSFVRSQESYWISHFLLSQIMNDFKESDTTKIYNASKVYGVSESYFRKLCQQAFTRGPKKQLRLWRAANSVLQLIDKESSISTIAGNNGYASSSHFSSEIKAFFGMTPREFKKLDFLFHE
ncbi:AraC-type DNA-binding protein [Izhakiella capsodis]|uniref:AraC-type DNA-binding protein n=1 Tax=Izhakiella capsodis TaxID=1367852 RepID=A0A1I5AUQ9_9GAMM|nr:helix-turn-helix domain-containing protein [Izhakiella capsodis]SFN66266.1 AraC-type DNA-binding protein [Izhakiella capsodis]